MMLQGTKEMTPSLVENKSLKESQQQHLILILFQTKLTSETYKLIFAACVQVEIKYYRYNGTSQLPPK